MGGVKLTHTFLGGTPTLSTQRGRATKIQHPPTTLPITQFFYAGSVYTLKMGMLAKAK